MFKLMMVTWVKSIFKIFSGSISRPIGNLNEILCLVLIAASAVLYEDICHKYQMTAESFIQ